ncbi:MAG: Ig-like domain-containing protein [Pseudomonas gingeri]
MADKAPPDVPAYARLTRAASWGSAPYRYDSSHDNIASVNAQSGEVTARGNGQCTITATDSQGEIRSYALTVKGIRQLHYLSSGADWQGMILVCAAADLDPVTRADIERLWTLYNPGNGRVAEYLGWLNYPFWTGDTLGAGTAWAYDLNGPSVNDNATAFGTDTYLPVLGISRDT